MPLDLVTSSTDALLLGLGQSSENSVGQEAGSFLRSCYAVSVAGVEVLIQTEVFLEYIPSVMLQPLPRAPERVLGLMQRRGQILPVFDASLRLNQDRSDRAISVLVIGSGAYAGAIALEGQPRLVNPQPMANTASPMQKPDASKCAFHAALDEAAQFDSITGRTLWPLNPEQFFKSLSSTGYSL
jgi:CheW-like domain